MGDAKPRHGANASEVATFRIRHHGVTRSDARSAVIAIKENNPFYVHPRFETVRMGGIPIEARVQNPDGTLPEFDPIPGLLAVLLNGAFVPADPLPQFDRYTEIIGGNCAILTETEVWCGATGGPVDGAEATVDNEAQVVGRVVGRELHGSLFLTIRGDGFTIMHQLATADSSSARLFADAVNSAGQLHTAEREHQATHNSATTNESVEGRLGQLQSLLDKNLISEDEFEAKRREILADL